MTDTSKATPRLIANAELIMQAVKSESLAKQIVEAGNAIEAMREALRKAAADLDGIIAHKAVTDTTRRIANDLRATLAAAEGKKP